MRNYLILLMLALGACAAEEAPLVASDVMIKAPMPGMNMSVGYLRLRNNTATPITLTNVTSPQFESVEMHETRIEDDVSRMVALGQLTIPARSTVIFEPGGKHLMLMRPVDESPTVTLDFYAGADIVLTIAAGVER